MKILKVTHGFPPDQMAGAEVYAYNVARELARRGETVEVLSPGSRPGVAEYDVVEEDVDGLTVLRLNNNFLDLHDLRATYDNRHVDARFHDLLETRAPDIVHVHHTIGTSANTIAIAAGRGIPVVVTLHDFWFHCARGQRMTPRGHLCTRVQPWRCALCVGKKRARYLVNWLGAYAAGKTRETAGEGRLRRGALLAPRAVAYVAREAGASPIRRRLDHMRRALAGADLLLAPSEFLRDEFLAQGAPADRIVFSEYGMDGSLLAEARAARRRDGGGGPVRFGFIGTLIPTKGPDLLVRAFQDLAPGAATLAIHGDGGGPSGPRYRARLEAMNRHPGVTFHGRFDNREVGRILADVDVLVVPSTWYENAPLTLHESVLAGIAAVTSDHGGMKEFAERFGTALTFRAGDAGSLRAALTRFIDEPGLARHLAQTDRAVRTVADDVDGLLEHYRVLTARTRTHA